MNTRTVFLVRITGELDSEGASQSVMLDSWMVRSVSRSRMTVFPPGGPGGWRGDLDYTSCHRSPVQEVPVGCVQARRSVGCHGSLA